MQRAAGEDRLRRRRKGQLDGKKGGQVSQKEVERERTVGGIVNKTSIGKNVQEDKKGAGSHGCGRREERGSTK